MEAAPLSGPQHWHLPPPRPHANSVPLHPTAESPGLFPIWVGAHLRTENLYVTVSFSKLHPLLLPVVSVSIQLVGKCLTQHVASQRCAVSGSFLAACGKIFALGPGSIQWETMSFIKLLNLSKSLPLHLLSGYTSSSPSGLLWETNEIAHTGGESGFWPSSDVRVVFHVLGSAEILPPWVGFRDLAQTDSRFLSQPCTLFIAHTYFRG